MFHNDSDFNQALADWNVASVTCMNYMFEGATKFNQCLSTWADKTPSNVSINGIFRDSGCPNNLAVGSYGPWCQGEDEQCRRPRTSPTKKKQKKNLKKSKK